MTVGTHIAEIGRQGIWASLTGGWYYEPVHSLFCNVVHLYLWILLFLSPLLIGVIYGGTASVHVISGYTITITTVFVVLKFSVFYLHNLFDTADPIPYPDEECSPKSGVEKSKREVDIEMSELRTTDSNSATDANIAVTMSGSSRIAQVRHNFKAVFDASVHEPREIEIWEDRTSGARMEQGLLPPSFVSMLATNSLNSSSNLMRRHSENDTFQRGTIERKMSEPCFTDAQRSWTRSTNQHRANTDKWVRRTKSTVETSSGHANTAISSVLSQRTLNECKKTATKSYPSKMNSTAAFLANVLSKRSLATGSRSASFDIVVHQQPSSANISVSSLNEKSSGSKMTIESASVVSAMKNREIVAEKAKHSNVDQSGPSNVREEAEIKNEDIDLPGPSKSKESRLQIPPELEVENKSSFLSSGSGWRPVFVSLGDLEHQSTNVLRRTSEKSDISDNMQIIASSSKGMDLKGEITKFLEELIDKHPETLDAIESIRMNRLSRSGNVPSSSIHSRSSVSSARLGERRSATVAALSNLALKDGTHVAVDHEDTSQGAVHSFQDEDGNWWTYAFDENGVGTAHALGSSRTLMEMIQNNNGTANHAPKLAILPENISDGSDEPIIDPLVPISASTNAAVRNRMIGDRQRAISSSSTESSTYIADTPSAVYHASSSALMSRHPNRERSAFEESLRQVVSFSTMAARLRNATRRRSHNSFTHDELYFDEQTFEEQGRPSSSHIGQASLRMDTPPVLRRMQFFTDISDTIGRYEKKISDSRKKGFYYQLKLLPDAIGGFDGIKLEIDRLSVAALFDRNYTLISTLFDIGLAAAVSILVGLLLSRSIFNDLSLVVFAIVVAGTHFSLLKSVQPDACSPIHGFNWLVTYSRPAYFCLLALVLLVLDGHWWDHKEALNTLGWQWNIYRFDSVSNASLMLAFRDLFAILLLSLPLAFSFGLLPQVNTLSLHVLEQIEIHIFGGTACFSLLSVLIQITKSVVSCAFLCFVARLAHRAGPADTQNVFFSAFVAATIAISYLLSRVSSNPGLMASCCRHIAALAKCINSEPETNDGSEVLESDASSSFKDPLPEQLKAVMITRLRSDLVITAVFSVLFFALHCTSVFSAAQPTLQVVTCVMCVLFGIFNHYIYMEFRTATPWRIFARPVFKSHEFAKFETTVAAKLMHFEIIHFYMLEIERNVLYPLMMISSMTVNKWALHPYLMALFSMRILRSTFSQPQLVYIPLAFSFLLTRYDLSNSFNNIESNFLLIFYVCVMIWPKVIEFTLKINFIMAYVAPWQISWGSAFHAFAQPFSVPHTALLCVQTIISSFVSAPLNPFLGSSFFTMSYVRPVKFWEKDYNTRRVDHSNTRLISQIDRGPVMDDSNLNAVFYEHLTRSLQTSLAGDLLFGRWSTSVQPGDCFVLASYYLNCLVHIIEVGNGFVTFQLRGLEFRGTYCHQREVEAIGEDFGQGSGCCCCSPGSLPGMLSLNTAWILRWLAWEVVTAKYVIDGYSITDNSAVNLLQVHELRRLLVTLYVKCIIFYALTSPKFSQWFRLPTIVNALKPIESSNRYVDLDPMFGSANDEDFDLNLMGVSRQSFTELYETWIRYCVQQQAIDNEEVSNENIIGDSSKMSRIIAFCFALSVVGRRALAAAAHNRHANAAESFLYGLHALFKGDFRITCQRDEWVFADMDLLRSVISPAVRMALKLHQDHFAAGDDFNDAPMLYERITHHLTRLFISHEHDPAWRRAIIANTPTLLALRHIYYDRQDDYKIIMLNKMHLNMRVIKLNRECVRAFWAGQQQELIFLRNRNPERGSIQNARQVLRNMINSSADQPIGYPIYVSPLTTSFVDSHIQTHSLSLLPATYDLIIRSVRLLWTSLRVHLGTSGSSNIQANPQNTIELVADSLSCNIPRTSGCPDLRSVSGTSGPRRTYRAENCVVSVGADGVPKVALLQPTSKNRDSVADTGDDSSIESQDEQETQYAKIVDLEQVFTCLDEPLKSTGEPLVLWPHPRWQLLGGRSTWDCAPMEGYRGEIVHKWVPFHPKRERRSHAGVIHLLSVKEMNGCYVPVGEKGIKLISKNEYDHDDKYEVEVWEVD